MSACAPIWNTMNGEAKAGNRISATNSAAVAGLNSALTMSPGFAARGGSTARRRASPRMPCGRSASVTTMMAKVSTTP